MRGAAGTIRRNRAAAHPMPGPIPASGLSPRTAWPRGWRLTGGIVALLCLAVVARANFYERRVGLLQILEPEVSYRTDLPKAADITAVLARGDGWISQRDQRYPATRDPITLWARFDLPPATAARRLLVETSPWDHAEFYVVREGRVVDRQHTGALVPPPERSVHVGMINVFDHSGFASVAQEPGARITVYARLATSEEYRHIRRLRFFLWDEPTVLAGERRDRVFQGVYAGVMLALIIYNLGLFVMLRERSYLYYVGLEACNMLIWGSVFGLTSEYLWPHLPGLEHVLAWFLVGVGFFSGVQFLRSYLDTAKGMPRSDRLLQGLGLLGLLSVPVAMLVARRDVLAGLAVLGAVPFAGFFVAVAVATLAIRRGQGAARHLLLAIGCSTGGTMMQTAAMFGLLPENDFTLTGSQIGGALMGIILSLGLGFRLRHLRLELAERELAEARRRSEHEREKRELIEAQNRELERRVSERTAELAAAREKVEGLLENILPRAIIEELKAKGITEPRRHEEVSILFTDFSGFTETVATIPAQRLVRELDEIFRAFDEIAAVQGLEKIKTIGDAYMAAAGLPMPAPDHAARCVRAGLAMTRFIEHRNQTSAIKWNLRVGVHSGAVVAGVVGKNKYAYDVWGDTVNLASRLESASERNRVNISAYTYELVRDRFDCEYRSKLAAKGKGEIDMYLVRAEKPDQPDAGS
ncbi:MAG: hypothetical protein JSR48_08290 [Verrucomicrobia bacterium]|nr:hypothetical protein [Verrucomicrobiota bacterium]